MSAAGVNGIVSPWFLRSRPAALGMAYNGRSIGGVIFSPHWVATIAVLGFAKATVFVALVMVVAMWVLADPGRRKRWDWRPMVTFGTPAPFRKLPNATPLPGSSLWLDRKV
jgi:hypothetical protein